MQKIFLISERRIKDDTNLNDAVFAEWIAPAISTAQDIDLQGVIGSCLYDRLLGMVSDGSISDSGNTAYKYLLDNHITSFLEWDVVARIVPIVGTKLDNLGAIISNDEHVANLDYRDKDLLLRHYQEIRDSYRLLLQNYLRNNMDLFPELAECACYGIKPNLDSSNSSNIFTGGRRSIKGLRLFKRL